MAIRNACVVWVRDFETGEWEVRTEPMGERDAVREAEQCRNAGLAAKALPLGTKPKKEAKP